MLGVPVPYTIGVIGGTDHASPYTYDTHVPLAFYGLPFQAGTYRTHAEPVDLAATLASLLGINAPSHAIGRVLTEALAPPRRVRLELMEPSARSGARLTLKDVGSGRPPAHRRIRQHKMTAT